MLQWRNLRNTELQSLQGSGYLLAEAELWVDAWSTVIPSESLTLQGEGNHAFSDTNVEAVMAHICF